jgi:hypothetical protein
MKPKASLESLLKKYAEVQPYARLAAARSGNALLRKIEELKPGESVMVQPRPGHAKK